jgi:hypothetical protein
MLKLRFYLLILYLIFNIVGCANQHRVAMIQPTIELPAKSANEDGYFWWYVKFRIGWPENKDPDWSIDILLADAVIEPVLIRYQDDIALWRFHRRAGRDHAGHQFSFIFYAAKAKAGSIFEEIKKNRLVNKLSNKNIIENIIITSIDDNERKFINDTSDEGWSETLQIAWPSYIMGVSAMWLELINQNYQNKSSNHDIDEIIAEYQIVNEIITEIWYEEGQHAFLHHLNAIFGYKPISIEHNSRY